MEETALRGAVEARPLAFLLRPQSDGPCVRDVRHRGVVFLACVAVFCGRPLSAHRLLR